MTIVELAQNAQTLRDLVAAKLHEKHLATLALGAVSASLEEAHAAYEVGKNQLISALSEPVEPPDAVPVASVLPTT